MTTAGDETSSRLIESLEASAADLRAGRLHEAAEVAREVRAMIEAHEPQRPAPEPAGVARR